MLVQADTTTRVTCSSGIQRSASRAACATNCVSLVCLCSLAHAGAGRYYNSRDVQQWDTTQCKQGGMRMNCVRLVCLCSLTHAGAGRYYNSRDVQQWDTTQCKQGGMRHD